MIIKQVEIFLNNRSKLLFSNFLRHRMQHDIKSYRKVCGIEIWSIQSFLDISCHFCAIVSLSFSKSYHVSHTLLTIISFYEKKSCVVDPKTFSPKNIFFPLIRVWLRYNIKRTNACPLLI